MPHRRMTFSKFIIEGQGKGAQTEPALGALLNDIMTACKFIAARVAKGDIAGDGLATKVNVQGEEQKPLDVLANDIVISCTEWGGQLAGIVSEELDKPYRIPDAYPRGPYLLLMDPLDGSSNIDINMTVGTIFSIIKAPKRSGPPKLEDFLQPGTQQVAAGYALYGPTSMLVLTMGSGTHGFTLNRDIGAYMLTHRDMKVPAETKEFAINASNERFWEPPVRRYVEECVKGKGGPRGKDFNMRWIASMVAEAHRILIRGGLFMYPRDTKDPSKAGRLRLLYECNPIAMIMEQAGGAATTGRERILDIEPTEIHQRIGLVMGSRAEVERIQRYHEEYERGEDVELDTPLFKTRSLFRTA